MSRFEERITSNVATQSAYFVAMGQEQQVQYDLVIFDMDGTLVDSEHLAERVLSEATHMLSRPMSVDEVAEAFRGRTLTYSLDVLTQREGQPLSGDFLAALNDNYISAVTADLRASEGARETVEKVKEQTTICVASNSGLESIEFCLKSADLLDLFEGHLYSGLNVPNPKPAPDVFLYAASSLGVAPERCLVLEDSALGLTAAKAAGMSAIGYCGNDLHSRESLEGVGFPVIDTFADFPPYLYE